MPIHNIGTSLNGNDLQERMNKDYEEGSFEFPVMNYDGATFIDPTGRPWRKPIGEKSFPWHYRNQRSPSLPSQMPDIDWSTRFNVRPMQTALSQDVVDMVVPVVAGNKPKDRSVLGTLPNAKDWDQEYLNQPNYEQTTVLSIDGISGLVEGLGDFVLGLAAQSAEFVKPRRTAPSPHRKYPRRRLTGKKARRLERKRAEREIRGGPHLGRQVLIIAAQELSHKYGYSVNEILRSPDRGIQRELRHLAKRALEEKKRELELSTRRARRKEAIIQDEINEVNLRPRHTTAASPDARTRGKIMGKLGAIIMRLMKQNGVAPTRKNIKLLADQVSRQWMESQENKMREVRGVISSNDMAHAQSATAQRYIEKEINL